MTAADEIALSSNAVASRDERLPLALCWLIASTIAAGLWAVILTLFFA